MLAAAAPASPEVGGLYLSRRERQRTHSVLHFCFFMFGTAASLCVLPCVCICTALAQINGAGTEYNRFSLTKYGKECNYNPELQLYKITANLRNIYRK